MATRTRGPLIPIAATSTPDPGVIVHELALGSAPVEASCWSVEPGHSSGVDSHAVHEAWLVAAGEGELLYDQDTFPLRAEQVFRFEPPLPHQVRNTGAERLVIFSIWWQP